MLSGEIAVVGRGDWLRICRRGRGTRGRSGDVTARCPSLFVAGCALLR